jgi:hypothetical protein
MKKLAILIAIAILLAHTMPALAVAVDEPRLFNVYMPYVVGKYRSEWPDAD